MLGPAFGRTDFSRIFIFGPPDFFADFLARFFLLIFVTKSAQKNPPGKSPGKSSKFIQQKSSNTFLQIAHPKDPSVLKTVRVLDFGPVLNLDRHAETVRPVPFWPRTVLDLNAPALQYKSGLATVRFREWSRTISALGPYYIWERGTLHVYCIHIYIYTDDIYIYVYSCILVH